MLFVSLGFSFDAIDHIILDAIVVAVAVQMVSHPQ
jgi:hypothetical protein